MRKKIFPIIIGLILLLVSTPVFAQSSYINEKEISILVSKIDKENNILKESWVKEAPKNLQEANETIKLLLEIYDDTSNAFASNVKTLKYKLELAEQSLDESIELRNEAKELQNKVNKYEATLSRLDKGTTALGIVAQYGGKFGDIEHQFTIQGGVLLGNLMVLFGPTFNIKPAPENMFNVGMQFGVGYWFR